MKLTSKLAYSAIAAIAFSQVAQADTHDYYADYVADYSEGTLINHSGTAMTSATEFWILGESDYNSNPSNVAGWRGYDSNQFMTVGFNFGLADVMGDDLTITMYSGPNSQANVLASSDGIEFFNIGSLGSGSGHVLREETFDFAGMFVDPVNYIRVERVAHGRRTGMFVDSFAGVAAVPEPATYALMLGGLGLVGFMAGRRKKA